jgi:peptide/nickel transport system substrate-binding protein
MSAHRILLAAVAAFALAVAGCGGAGGAKSGGTLRIGTTDGVDTLNPFVAANTDSSTLFMQIYPHLVQYDGDLHIAPDFAKSWSVSDGGRTLTFHTASGGRWSDGKPLTAKDAAYSLNLVLRYASGPTAAMAPFTTAMKSAVAPNATTLVVTYDRPVANALAQLQFISILPQHVWEKAEGAGGKGLTTFQNPAPVVSGGAFKLVRYKKGAIALATRNPYFYGPKPKIDGFGLQLYSDADAMLLALKQGSLDTVESVAPNALKSVRDDDSLQLLTGPSLLESILGINVNAERIGHRELLKPEVRQALSTAIDRTSIVDVAWLGHAMPGTSVLPPGTGDWFDDGIPVDAYDATAANELLDRLGYARKNDVRYADGHPMSYTVYVVAGVPGANRTFDILRQNMQAIGVELNEKLLDVSAAYAAMAGSDGKFRGFDFVLTNSGSLVDPDFALGSFTCAQRAGEGGNDPMSYCDPAYDRDYAEQGAALEAPRRQQVVKRMQRQLAADRPALVLNYPQTIEAHSTQWDGFVLSPFGSVNPLSRSTLIDVHRTN